MCERFERVDHRGSASPRGPGCDETPAVDAGHPKFESSPGGWAERGGRSGPVRGSGIVVGCGCRRHHGCARRRLFRGHGRPPGVWCGVCGRAGLRRSEAPDLLIGRDIDTLTVARLVGGAGCVAAIAEEGGVGGTGRVDLGASGGAAGVVGRCWPDDGGGDAGVAAGAVHHRGGGGHVGGGGGHRWVVGQRSGPVLVSGGRLWRAVAAGGSVVDAGHRFVSCRHTAGVSAGGGGVRRAGRLHRGAVGDPPHGCGDGAGPTVRGPRRGRGGGGAEHDSVAVGARDGGSARCRFHGRRVGRGRGGVGDGARAVAVPAAGRVVRARRGGGGVHRVVR